MGDTARQAEARARTQRNLDKLPWSRRRRMTQHTKDIADEARPIETGKKAVRARTGKPVEEKPSESHAAQVIRDKDEAAELVGLKRKR